MGRDKGNRVRRARRRQVAAVDRLHHREVAGSGQATAMWPRVDTHWPGHTVKRCRTLTSGPWPFFIIIFQDFQTPKF
jgi:hypothetical protein